MHALYRAECRGRKSRRQNTRSRVGLRPMRAPKIPPAYFTARFHAWESVQAICDGSSYCLADIQRRVCSRCSGGRSSSRPRPAYQDHRLAQSKNSAWVSGVLLIDGLALQRIWQLQGLYSGLMWVAIICNISDRGTRAFLIWRIWWQTRSCGGLDQTRRCRRRDLPRLW
ncbi:hypothetical protein B0H12DRAFT_1145840 [Mycena haematopus]|nr:hypothetical protein B0H12DRAFT_1145840 [Mycena haematopus]